MAVNMKLSEFGRRFSADMGTVQLMEDLNAAMSGGSVRAMLGGGNPADIPEAQAVFQDCMQRIVADKPRLANLLGDYGSPKGDADFIAELAEMLTRQCGREITADHIVLTSGSQSAFFILFNLLGGDFSAAGHKRILLPMVPEYIGYGDVGLSDNLFTAYQPAIETGPQRTFKYHLDFERLAIEDDIGAICVSRPTNPTGNVLTGEEIDELDTLAKRHGIPLIIDNAYGMPFPNIIFSDVGPVWNENIILSMSLSKLGLPGVRTGIVVARPELIHIIKNINGVLNLALGNLGPALALEIIRSGEMNRLCNDIIRPYYWGKAQRTAALLREKLDGLNYYIHKPEGAIFLWLWLPDLPISSQELYQNLKRRGVLVIAGEHFFPGLQNDWPHRHQCIRISYVGNDAAVETGINIIADELRKLSV